MKILNFLLILVIMLLGLACNKDKECTCYHNNQNACDKDRDCEWVLIRNTYIQNGSGHQAISSDTEWKCQCEDKTVYESLTEKSFTLTSDTATSSSVASLRDNEFSFAVIHTEKGRIPALISSATRNLIGGTNKSHVYSYFAEASSSIDIDALNSGKSIRNVSIEQKVSNSVIPVDYGSLIYFVSGNGLKGIIRVNQVDLSAEPKVLEMTVKYYHAGETFDKPAAKGFTKIRKNIRLLVDNTTKGFYNIASADNSILGAELSFGAIPGELPTHFDRCVLVSPDQRSKHYVLKNNGDIRTEFKEVTEGDFNTIYEFTTDEPLAKYSEIINLPRSAFMPQMYMFRSSNGKTGLIKINKTTYLTFNSHEIDFELKYSE